MDTDTQLVVYTCCTFYFTGVSALFHIYLFISLLHTHYSLYTYAFFLFPRMKSTTLDADVATVPPVIEDFKFFGKLQAGMRTRVYCNVAQGDVPIQLKWAKDGRIIAADSSAQDLAGISLRQVDQFSLALIIENLAVHHNGNYSCVAANEAATVNYTTELLVNGESV